MKLAPIAPIVIIIIAAILLAVATVLCVMNKKYRHTRYFRRIGIAFLIVAIFARPMVGSAPLERETSNVNVFFVVDNTGSMATRDMDGYSKFRFQVLADDMKKIVERLAGSKYSIITLDYTTYRAMPLIGDANSIVSYAEALQPKDSYLSHSSDLNALLKTSLESIKAYNERFPDRESILIFMSDGEDNDLKEITVPDDYRHELSGGAVIGYGTHDGAHVNKINNNEVLDDYVKDKNYNEVISKLDSANLETVASKLSLPYYERNKDDSFLNKKESFFGQSNKNEKDTDITGMFELYWIIAIIAAGLIYWDFLDILNRLLLERKAVK